jgi:hypothetical protein
MGPNRRIRTIQRPRTALALAGDRRCSFDALVGGRQTALFIPVAISVIKMRQLARRCYAVCNRGEKLPKLVERAHI